MYGKSTFLSVVTSATPKIANYHFTTLDPNLGVVKSSYGDSFVIADIPGIIEGASQGTGLGIQFLRHIERTRVLLHFVDISSSEGRNPVEDYDTINKELKEYSEKLANRTQIIVANKADIYVNNIDFEELEKVAEKNKQKIFKISAATGEGITELINYVSKLLKTLPKESIIDISKNSKEKIYRLDKKEKFKISKEGKIFVVTGSSIENIMRRVNVDDYESLFYLHRKMDEIGLNQALKEKGVKDGDTIRLVDYEMMWED